MRNKKKLCAGILMLLLLTGCSSQEVLQEVPQTIVLPESQIDTMPVQETAAAENDNTESIDKVFQCVLIDHPEIFYTTGYTYTKYSRGEKTVGIDFAGTYDQTKEEAVARAEAIRSVTAEWLSGMEEAASEYDKVKAVYEAVIFSTNYDLSAADNQNIASVFLGGASVCQGYAKATQYLLNHLGVMCTLVQGTVDTGEAHAWNLVQVDGDYYYVDTTWGDASYRMENGSEQRSLPEINYDYLCVTTEDLLRTHEQMQAVFDRAIEGGRTEVTIKCADELCYQEICHALIDEQEIFSYMQIQGNSNTVTYAQNGKQLSLTFWVTNE